VCNDRRILEMNGATLKIKKIKKIYSNQFFRIRCLTNSCKHVNRRKEVIEQLSSC
jgi:hypothetical protein